MLIVVRPPNADGHRVNDYRSFETQRADSATASVTGVDNGAKADPEVPIPGGWYRHAYTYKVGHTKAAASFRKLSRWLGGIAVVFATIAGTTLVADLAASSSVWMTSVAAGFAVASAVLQAFVTFAGYGQLELDHHKAAIGFAGIQRELDEIIVAGEKVPTSKLDQLGKEPTSAAEDASAPLAVVPLQSSPSSRRNSFARSASRLDATVNQRSGSKSRGPRGQRRSARLSQRPIAHGPSPEAEKPSEIGRRHRESIRSSRWLHGVASVYS